VLGCFLVELGGLRLLARHPLLEPELLELLIIVRFADIETAAEVAVRISGLQLATLGYLPRSLRSAPTSAIAAQYS
jgi:hypothetical protein